MSESDDGEIEDYRGNTYDQWLSLPVETPHGVGTVAEDHGDSVYVTHEFPTHGQINGTYEKSEVAVITNPVDHPAYSSQSSYRSHDYEDLEVMEEPTLHLP